MPGEETAPNSSSGRKEKKFGPRHRARARAVDLLFEAEAKDTDPSRLVSERIVQAEFNPEIPAVPGYTTEIVGGVADNRERVDSVIADHLHKWTLERLPAVDRAVLRVAVWELLFADDVPPFVAVDEAVELAKELSTDDSPAFVNGVLGSVVDIAEQVRAAAKATSHRDDADSDSDGA